MSRFTLHPRDPNALAASTAVLEGFAPAAYEGEPGVLRLAVVADPAFAPGGAERAVGVVARPAGEAVAVEVFGNGSGPTPRCDQYAPSAHRDKVLVKEYQMFRRCSPNTDRSCSFS